MTGKKHPFSSDPKIRKWQKTHLKEWLSNLKRNKRYYAASMKRRGYKYSRSKKKWVK